MPDKIATVYLKHFENLKKILAAITLVELIHADWFNFPFQIWTQGSILDDFLYFIVASWVKKGARLNLSFLVSAKRCENF